ncbi:putative Disease resistance protein (TIR-NBS-LRR class) [Quillaja saponaria]|uniref:Disease resistance protein (TIR-NBS-LRR class) n=1 Tax=Quillaja saponaria TaxID=32244 RepID=A0AAD7LQV0_QUISA|nr:putative Disease resistance protein (TIR-NBS-LRR class) [Quillaja saponaria]
MLKKTSEIPKAVIQGSNNLLNSLMIHMGGYNKITTTLSHILQEWSASGFGDFVFPTNDYFDWFIYEDEGPSVYFELPQIVEGSLKGITACVAYSSSVGNIPSKYLVCVINHTKGTIQILNPRKVLVLTSQEDQ